MASFFLNDRSLHGQFSDDTAFIASLTSVLEMRKRIEAAGHRLLVDKDTRAREVIPNRYFSQVIQDTRRPDFIRMVRNWLSKAGPFWRQTQSIDENCLYSIEGDDLIDSILAEAAWRAREGEPTSLVSFAPSDFTHTPIMLESHDCEPPRPIPLENYWEMQALASYLKSLVVPPRTWPDWFRRIRDRFDHLVFGEEFEKRLARETFSRANAKQATRQLEILDRYVACRKDPSRKDELHQIDRDYFSSEKVNSFSPGSETDFARFRHKMKFRLPGGTEKVLCEWHGKIRHNNWRLHFDNPNSDPICIVYLGPKLAKK